MRKKILERTLHKLQTLPRFAYVLAVLTAFGLGVGFYRLAVGLDATTNLSKDFPWGIWISFDLTTVALSGGAFTLAALVYVFHIRSAPATRPTVSLAC
jgi:Ni/Fe-hydrogenase subunit HybB-like protein